MHVVFLISAIVAGCTTATSPQPNLADQVSSARTRMHQRFEASRRMQLAIALGKLDLARVEAATIASLDEPDMLPEWRPYVENIRAAARNIRDTQDTIGAARASAVLARECAKCHEASKSKVVLPAEQQPPADDRLASQMFLHQWAAARMWDGLIAPSDERWRQGAKLLAEAPLAITAESGALGIADDVSRVRLLAKRAQDSTSQDEHAEIYGELLTRCSHCHSVIRD
jgi:hypothetical protein